MRFLLTFATQTEAKKTLEITDAKPHHSTRGVFTFSKGIILITGIGSFATFASLNAYITESDEVWNLGFSGALQKEFSVGKIFPIRTCAKLLWHPVKARSSESFASALFSEIELPVSEGKKLVTSDRPIDTSKEAQELGKNWDLVDMEGYAIAWCANTQKKPCKLYKIVSDFCSEETSKTIREQAQHLSEQLAYFVKTEMGF